MSKLEQAARQAFDALEDAYENGFLTGITGLKTIDVLTAMREALAEQADGEQWSPDDMAYRPSGLSMEQAEQEPVAFIGQGLLPIVPEDLQKLRKHEPGTATLYDTPLYAAPVRTKDLTDDEIEEIGKSYFDEWSFGFARAVIAADREKNRG